VTDTAGVLKIQDTKRLINNYKGATLVLYLPENAFFNKADIVTGAGKVDFEALSADFIELELGAGEVNIKSLNAFKSADIDGGAGKITVSDGSLANLDLDMGVGQLNLTSALVGESELDLGIGETNITLVGNKEDYNLKAEKGIGNINVDGGIQNIVTAKNTVEINGGIGSINIGFIQ